MRSMIQQQLIQVYSTLTLIVIADITDEKNWNLVHTITMRSLLVATFGASVATAALIKQQFVDLRTEFSIAHSWPRWPPWKPLVTPVSFGSFFPFLHIH